MHDPVRIGQGKLRFWLGPFSCRLFLQATKPIFDPDFWWYLKTGQTMVQVGALRV